MKTELRQIVKEKRKELNIALLSEKIMKNLFSLNEYKSAKKILNYYPLKYEVQTLDCFNDCSKTWFLPRVSGNNLEVCPYDSQQLSKGNFNIQEPTNQKCLDLNNIDMVIIPCLAADKNGYRIGYGKGYYDRFLPSLPCSCKKVLLVYSEFLFDTIYPEKFDICADVVVSDKEILRI